MGPGPSAFDEVAFAVDAAVDTELLSEEAESTSMPMDRVRPAGDRTRHACCAAASELLNLTGLWHMRRRRCPCMIAEAPIGVSR
jgi:hypothetical protein